MLKINKKNLILLNNINKIKNPPEINEKKYHLVTKKEEQFLINYKNISTNKNNVKNIKESKIAILISGLHYYKNYKHWSGKVFDIDFRHYFKNIKENIYDYFGKECEIDTFICTQESEIIDQLLKYYQPILCEFCDGNRLAKTKKVIEIFQKYVKESKKKYKYICITRFDIYFINKLNHLQFNKFNVATVNDKISLIDDNFYFFPFEYLDKVLFSLNDLKNINIRTSMHNLKKYFEKKMKVNYIKNDVTVVNNSSFYTLTFFSNIEYSFILNRYSFTENIEYNIDGNVLILNDNSINLKTKAYSIDQINKNGWFGLIIDKKGDYKLSFSLITDNDILGDFIYLNKIIETNKIIKDIKNDILIDIKTQTDNELIAFNFNNYENLFISITDLNLLKHV